MKTFTEQEVEVMIRATITETAEGIFEWFRNETSVFNIKTREVMDDITEINLRQDYRSAITDYIYPRLEKHGITITQNK